MKCTICHKEITLSPSAAERALLDRTGKTAAYFTGLFTEHSECTLAKRQRETSELMARVRHENRNLLINRAAVKPVPIRGDWI